MRDNIGDATILELQRRMEQGRVSARTLVDWYEERISDSDGLIGSVIELNPAARTIAEALDVERGCGKVRGALHGIPILLKDNVATDDGMGTTAGSLALVGARPRGDAEVARRLRAAGAVFLGKANMSEWANFRSPNSTSGWSARGGQCRNPYALERSPSGSSSGCAAATAASFCAASIGTETDGSIISPSHACSVVGMKATIDLVSRHGVIPISDTQDCPGPIARAVDDAAAILSVLNSRNEDYTIGLERSSLRGARLGVWREGLFGVCAEADTVVEQAFGDLSRLGATVVDPVNLPQPDRLSEMEVLLWEFGPNLDRYLQALPSCQVRSLSDVIRFNEEHREAELAYFGQELFYQAQEHADSFDPHKYRQLRMRTRQSSAGAIGFALTEHNLDAIVAPTGPPAGLIDLGNGDAPMRESSWAVAAIAGYPIITVPAGYASGTPVGLSFIGSAFAERRLLELARAFERGTQRREAPVIASLSADDAGRGAEGVGRLSRDSAGPTDARGERC